MRKIKRLLALLFCTVFVVSEAMGSVTISATTKNQNEEQRIQQVLDNYDEYLQYISQYYNLINDYNYSYEMLNDAINNSGFWKKNGVYLTTWVSGNKMKVTDCMEYLSTILTMMERGMCESFDSMAGYNVTNGAFDYGKDTLSMATDIMGFGPLKDLNDDLSLIADLSGIAGDTLDILINDQDELNTTIVFAQDYAYKKKFLSLVAANSSCKNMAKAAERLIQINEMQAGYILSQLADGAMTYVKTANDLVSFATDKGFVEWAGTLISSQTGKAAKTELLAGVSAFAEKANAFMLGAKIGIYVGNLAAGNEYKNFNEVAALADIADCVKVGIAQYEPQASMSDSSKYEALLDYVPLLETLCCVRLRGEYVANQLAKGNGTIYSWFTKNDSEYDDHYERAYALICDEYDLIANILITDETHFEIIWRTDDSVTYDSNGNEWCVNTVNIPSGIYSNMVSKEVLEKIKNSEVTQAEADTASITDDFDKANIGKYNYPNMISRKYEVGGRCDDKIVTFAYRASVYYSGAMHPMNYSFANTYDSQTGEKLKLSDIVVDDSCYGKLSELVSKHLDANQSVSTDEIENVKQSWANKTNIGTTWYFTADGLRVVYDPYAVASYAAGFVTGTVPYSELEGLIKDEYLKVQKRSTGEGSVIAEQSGENISASNNILLTNDGSKPCIYFSAEGIVYDVYIGSAEFNGSYYNTKEPYITMNTMSPNTLVLFEVKECTEEGNYTIYVKYKARNGIEYTVLYGVTQDGLIFER